MKTFLSAVQRQSLQIVLSLHRYICKCRLAFTLGCTPALQASRTPPALNGGYPDLTHGHLGMPCCQVVNGGQYDWAIHKRLMAGRVQNAHAPSMCKNFCSTRSLDTSGVQGCRLLSAGVSGLFTSRTDTMVQFLWQDDLLSVARFIADCFDHFQSGVIHLNQP
jgi:hypothetical protein